MVLVQSENLQNVKTRIWVLAVQVYIAGYFKQMHEPFPRWQILDASILKKFADGNFKLDENGGKHPKMVKCGRRRNRS